MARKYLAALGATWILAVGSAAAQTLMVSLSEPIELSVLSYNTHGLPAWIAFDDPAARLLRIGHLANAYDVALLQEDFAHHEQLLEGATHPVVERGNAARFSLQGLLSPLCGDCGSGLTILKRFAPQYMVEVHREAFERCSGWLFFTTGSDCWATKGILSTRLRLANGTEVDFYDVHLDAGQTPGDQRARAHQLERLRARIQQRTDRQALVVGGDFNLRSDIPADTTLLSAFRDQLAMEEIGIDVQPDGWTHQVDYIFFRSGEDTSLELVGSGVASEFVHEGRRLSDHPALFARFRVRPRHLEAPSEPPVPVLAPLAVMGGDDALAEHVAAGPEEASAAGAPAETGL